MTSTDNNLVGIIPAAGLARRLGGLPFSKELYPLGVENGKVKVASRHLLDSMAEAGASQIHMIIRNGKWDIPAYYGSSFSKEVSIGYHIAEYGYGVPFTVNQAYPFIKDKNVLLGFPDIIFNPHNAFANIYEELIKSDIPIALGLFPVSNPAKFDMVVMDDFKMINRIIIKPTEGNFQSAWIIAAWKPEFSYYLNQFVKRELSSKSEDELNNTELHFGHVIISALEDGLKARGVLFENGSSLDIGTPEDLYEYAYLLSFDKNNV